MKEFTGGSLTVYELMLAMQRGEIISLVLGRSGVLRLYILPLSWASKVEGPWDGWTIDDAQRVSVSELGKEEMAGLIIMDQVPTVVSVNRGVPQGIVVPANPYWREKVGGDR